MSKLFSILTASYNKGKYINDWARSVLAQDYRPLEVVFVNDASNDKTSVLMKHWIQEFNKNGIQIKYLRNKKRQFCSTSYQIATNNATGYFLGILDSDDMLGENAVSYVMNLYNKYSDISYIYTQFMICDKNMRHKNRGFCQAPAHGQTLLSLGLKTIHGFSHWRTFSNRLNYSKLWKNGMQCAVDKHMGYRLEELGNGLFVDEVCYLYRSGSVNSVSSGGAARIMWKKVIKETIKRRSKEGFKVYPIIQHHD